MFGPQVIEDAQLEKILKEDYWQPTENTSELSVGDEVLISVGTWSGRFPNDGWLWVRGYVVRKTIKSGNDAADYAIVRLGKSRNSVFTMTLDPTQKTGRSYGRIYKRLAMPHLPDAKLEIV